MDKKLWNFDSFSKEVAEVDAQFAQIEEQPVKFFAKESLTSE
jgi:hypothetical protein